MSTPFAIRFFEEDGTIIFDAYSKWDGDIETVGKFLAYRLQTMEVVNQIPMDLRQRMYCGGRIETLRHYAHGMSCLSAQIVSDLKDGLGGIHINRPAPEYDRQLCYVYEIRLSNVKGQYGRIPHITCRSKLGIEYQGLPGEYFNLITSGGPF